MCLQWNLTTFPRIHVLILNLQYICTCWFQREKQKGREFNEHITWPSTELKSPWAAEPCSRNWVIKRAKAEGRHNCFLVWKTTSQKLSYVSCPVLMQSTRRILPGLKRNSKSGSNSRTESSMQIYLWISYAVNSVTKLCFLCHCLDN